MINWRKRYLTLPSPRNRIEVWKVDTPDAGAVKGDDEVACALQAAAHEGDWDWKLKRMRREIGRRVEVEEEEERSWGERPATAAPIIAASLDSCYGRHTKMRANWDSSQLAPSCVKRSPAHMIRLAKAFAVAKANKRGWWRSPNFGFYTSPLQWLIRSLQWLILQVGVHLLLSKPQEISKLSNLIDQE